MTMPEAVLTAWSTWPAPVCNQVRVQMLEPTMALSELAALSRPRSSGGGWQRSSARSGKAAATVLAAVILASSMNSSTSWLASLRTATGVGRGLSQ